VPSRINPHGPRAQVGSTDANARSSRSHTLFRVTVESRATKANAAAAGVRVSTLQVVDLAGSESANATAATNGARGRGWAGGRKARVPPYVKVSTSASHAFARAAATTTTATGARQRESACINKSLLALGKVVRLLADQARGRAALSHHVPFRESKLTRLLQPSLGGNAQVCLVCTLTPAASCVDESLSTLSFASRAKRVKQTPRVNEAPPDQATLIER